MNLNIFPCLLWRVTQKPGHIIKMLLNPYCNLFHEMILAPGAVQHNHPEHMHILQYKHNKQYMYDRTTCEIWRYFTFFLGELVLHSCPQNLLIFASEAKTRFFRRLYFAMEQANCITLYSHIFYYTPVWISV